MVKAQISVISVIHRGFQYLFPSRLFVSCVLQDYPSLALMNEKMAENNINLIFAVTNIVQPLYKVNKRFFLCHSISLFQLFLIKKIKTHVVITGVQ